MGYMETLRDILAIILYSKQKHLSAYVPDTSEAGRSSDKQNKLNSCFIELIYQGKDRQ